MFNCQKQDSRAKPQPSYPLKPPCLLMMKKMLRYIILIPILLTTIIVSLKFYTYNFIRQETSFTNQKLFTKPDTTEVFILGSLHKTTKNIDYDDLYNLLETIKPNIILYEIDSSHFDKNMNWKTKWWRVKLPNFLDKYKQSNLEEIATKKYLYHNKNAIIRPYEWGLRDKFHKENNILTTPNLIFQKLYELNSNQKLTTNEKNILEEFYALTKQLEKFGDSSLYEINTIFQDSIAKNRQNSQYHKIKTIIDNNHNFMAYRTFYKINEAYWDLRNMAMVENIKKYIKLNPNSRIVVLNGYYHRYYLRNELQNKQKDLNFKLKDIEKQNEATIRQ
jgi:hypothetical protein